MVVRNKEHGTDKCDIIKNNIIFIPLIFKHIDFLIIRNID